MRDVLSPRNPRRTQAELVTDGLRALLLEIHGYKASVFEFISPEHTSKNLMIAAIKRAAREDRRRASLDRFCANCSDFSASASSDWRGCLRAMKHWSRDELAILRRLREGFLAGGTARGLLALGGGTGALRCDVWRAHRLEMGCGAA